MKKKQNSRAKSLVNTQKRILLLVLLLVLFASGCGKSTSPPMMNDKSPDFQETRFLAAEGIGNTKTDARRQALAELSSIFESRVQSQTTSFASSSLGPDNMELFEKTIKSQIRVISSVRLEGAKIGKVWQDEATGNFHALAILNRMDAGKNWSRDLERLDNRLRAEAIALETIIGKLPRMAALNSVMSLALERHAIESRMMVINYPAPELELDLAKMTSELALIQSKLRFYIDITGEHGTIAGKFLSRTLTQNGILITLNMDEADAWVMGQGEVTPMSLANPKIVFVRATGDVEVFETNSHDLFVQINENLRKGHIDRDEAKHKAIMAISQQISQRLLSALGLDNPQTKESVQ